MSENAARDNNSLSLHQYRRDRRKFTCIVYSLFIFFLVISLGHWIPLLLLSEAATFVKDHPYVSVVWLTVALITVAMFVFFEEIRLLFPINWIIALVIVEGVILGITQAIVASNLLTFVAAFGVVLFFFFVLIIIGATLSRDITLDVIFLFIMAMVLFISALFCIMMYFLAGFLYYSYIFAGIVFITVSMFIMYHAQTICGSRYAEMRVRDYLLAALILYHHFVILFIVVFYLMWKLAIFHDPSNDKPSNNDDEDVTKTQKSLQKPLSFEIVCRNYP